MSQLKSLWFSARPTHLRSRLVFAGVVDGNSASFQAPSVFASKDVGRGQLQNSRCSALVR